MSDTKKPRAKRGVKYLTSRDHAGGKQLYREFVSNMPQSELLEIDFLSSINSSLEKVISGNDSWRDVGWKKATPEQRDLARMAKATILQEFLDVIHSCGAEEGFWKLRREREIVQSPYGRRTRRLNFAFVLKYNDDDKITFDMRLAMEFAVGKKDVMIRSFGYQFDNIKLGGRPVYANNLFIRKIHLGGKFSLLFDGEKQRSVRHTYDATRDPQIAWQYMREFFSVITNDKISMIETAANTCNEQFTNMALETLCGITGSTRSEINTDFYGNMQFGYRGTKVTFADIVSKFPDDVVQPTEEDEDDE